jgi:hypothetical protein
MATYTSRREKRQDLTDVVLVVISIVLISILVGSGSLDSNLFNFQSNLVHGSAVAVSGSGNSTFAMDEQYWAANCSHGWSSDRACENIVLRAQTCSTQSVSTYCSEYKDYMQKFKPQTNIIQY